MGFQILLNIQFVSNQEDKQFDCIVEIIDWNWSKLGINIIN